MKTDGSMVKQQIIHVRNSECVFHSANIGPEDVFIFGIQLVLIMCWVITRCLGFPASCLRHFINIFFASTTTSRIVFKWYLNYLQSWSAQSCWQKSVIYLRPKGLCFAFIENKQMDKEGEKMMFIIKVCRINLSFFSCPWESKADISYLLYRILWTYRRERANRDGRANHKV